jgi:biotin transport system substrate-specific component
MLGRGDGEGAAEAPVRKGIGKGADVHENELRLAGAPSSPAYSSAALGRAARIVACALSTAVAAQLAVHLPFTPVPVTMQTVFVVLAGVALGPRDGCYSMLSYLALGLMGAPVFASFNAGPAALLGPTGGYLVAFPAAALLAGFVARGLGGGRLAVFAASLSGMTLILASGASWLSLAAGISFGHAAALGVTPFLAGELVKAAAAAGLPASARRAGV